MNDYLLYPEKHNLGIKKLLKGVSKDANRKKGKVPKGNVPEMRYTD